VRNLNSMLLPRMVPTSYSARYMMLPVVEIPSSPPVSTQSEEFEASTPANPAQLRKSPVQLISPCESEQAGITHSQQRQSHGDRDVTSSVVKNEAANGLLELIRAAAGS
jgi:hypothetical protein